MFVGRIPYALIKFFENPEFVTGNNLKLVGPHVLKCDFRNYVQFHFYLAALKRTALRGRRIYPISSVIARPAWDTIAEPALPRSLPLVAYLNLGYIRRLTDSGYSKKSGIFSSRISVS